MAAVHDATPEGWYFGRPYFDERHNRWEQYAYDSAEKPVVGKRSREWTAVGPTEPTIPADAFGYVTDQLVERVQAVLPADAVLHKEELEYENIQVKTRSYK